MPDYKNNGFAMTFSPGSLQAAASTVPGSSMGGGNIDYDKENLDFLRNYLKNTLSGGLQHRKEYAQRAKRNINQGTAKDTRSLRQMVASSGLRGSGAGFSALSKIAGKRSNALLDLETNLNKMDLQTRENALRNILGLERLDLSAYSTDLNAQLSKERLKEQARQFDEQLAFQEEQSEFDFFRDLLPGIIAGASSIGASAAMPGLSK